MRRRYNIDLAHACPRYEKAVQILGKRWTARIVRALLGGSRRFGEISAYVGGISDRLVSKRLQELETGGIVEKRVYPETPVRIEYVLTDKGRELQQVVEAIQRWANKGESPAVASSPASEPSPRR